MAEARWLDAREAHLWDSYLCVMRQLNAALDSDLVATSGLSTADYAVLVPLSESADGIVRTRDLCVALTWERSRLSHQVSRMEKRGLVTREDCDTDARGSMVRLTDAGRAAIEAAAPAHVAAVRRCFFDHLSQQDQDALVEAFDRILTGLPTAPATAG